MVGAGAVVGTQFHIEQSGAVGLERLRVFLAQASAHCGNNGKTNVSESFFPSLMTDDTWLLPSGEPVDTARRVSARVEVMGADVVGALDMCAKLYEQGADEVR